LSSKNVLYLIYLYLKAQELAEKERQQKKPANEQPKAEPSEEEKGKVIDKIFGSK
jgi:hypothetical protein